MLRTNVDPHEVAEAMKAHRDHLTEQARQGDLEAFAALHHSLSKDPVDLGVAWRQFQKEI